MAAPAADLPDGTEHDSVQRFLDMSIDLLAVVDLDTTILAASRSWERTLGWLPAEVVGTPLLGLFHADDLPRVEEELARLLRGGDAVAVVVRVRASDGSHRWVQGNARSDLDAGRIYVTAADITERMELEQALRRQLGLEELVASIASRLIGTEPGQVVEEIRAAIGQLAEVLGADRARYLRGARHPDEVLTVAWRSDGPEVVEIPLAMDPAVRAWWRQSAAAGKVVHVEDLDALAETEPEVAASFRAEGLRSVLLVPLPPHRRYWGFLAFASLHEAVHFSDAANALLLLAGDCFMTALSQSDAAAALLDARRELQHRNDELERSNEELERFAYSAAHDLKAPLSRVEMALSSSRPGQPPAPELLDIARRATARMRQLIEDLLAFSAVGQTAGAVVPVELDELLAEVLVDLEPTLRSAGAHVEAAQLPQVLGHRALLGQLLQNLLGNALKYLRPDVPGLIRVGAERSGEGVTISVADNGIGIAPERRADVFGVFTRLSVDEPQPGSGIGLATCAKVAHHHGGRIWIDDGIDGGIAVRVWLPDEPVSPG